MTNRLLQRKQMVRALMFIVDHISSLSSSPEAAHLSPALSVGRRCPPSRQGHSPKDWNQGEARQDVQDHPWCRLRLWLQDSVWWRQDNRLCHGVRLPRLCQEEWAQAQTGQGEFWITLPSQVNTSGYTKIRELSVEIGIYEQEMYVLSAISQILHESGPPV